MSVQDKLEEIIRDVWENIAVLSSGIKPIPMTEVIRATAQALLTSPDIAVVEKDKLQKMKRVMEAIVDAKTTIMVWKVQDMAKEALADLEG